MHFFTNFITLLLFHVHHTKGHAVINTDTTNYETKNASHAEYPFMVSIGRKGNKQGNFTYRQGHFCGGALITRGHVLTAAHCLVDEEPNGVRVIVGMTDFSRATVTYDVSSWKTYNEWDGKLDSGSDHDIAVIELRDFVTEAYIDTIDIYPRYINKNGIQLETAGWGQTERYKTSPVLLKIRLTLVSLKICEHDLMAETNKPYSIDMQHMCTRSPLKMHLGEGDSGGPLILRKNGVPYVVGVNEAFCSESTSFLNTHCRISYYKKFINETTNSRRSCTFIGV